MQPSEASRRFRLHAPDAAVAALLILLSVVAASILVARIARAFVLTGLSKETARFQARSIITGTGFTTDEADHIVNHPVRRRIALVLMLIGNAGLVTAVSTIILSFTSTGTAGEALRRGLILAVGLGVLAYLALSNRVDRYLSTLTEWMLDRVVGFQVRDMHTILNLGGGYMVTRMEVAPEPGSPAKPSVPSTCRRRDSSCWPSSGRTARSTTRRGRGLHPIRRLRHRVRAGRLDHRPLRSAPMRVRPDGGDGRVKISRLENLGRSCL